MIHTALEGLRVVACIPCFNTEKHIGDVVARTKKYVDNVIVINDGSHDETTKKAQAAGATVISHGVNLGKGAAMKFGAETANADIIVFLDGDGQHNPDEIPLLLQPIIDGQADIVFGSRFLHDSKKTSTPLNREIANFAASGVISCLVSSPLTRKQNSPGKLLKTNGSKPTYRLVNGRIKWLTDCTGGFRAVKKDSWEKLNIDADGYEVETEMIYEAVRNGLNIAEVPVSCVWEGELSKLSIIKDGSRTLNLLLKHAINDFRRTD
jgi:glycosyltransferase involved in cell wall biosynthesis